MTIVQEPVPGLSDLPKGIQTTYNCAESTVASPLKSGENAPRWNDYWKSLGMTVSGEQTFIPRMSAIDIAPKLAEVFSALYTSQRKGPDVIFEDAGDVGQVKDSLLRPDSHINAFLSNAYLGGTQEVYSTKICDAVFLGALATGNTEVLKDLMSENSTLFSAIHASAGHQKFEPSTFRHDLLSRMSPIIERMIKEGDVASVRKLIPFFRSQSPLFAQEKLPPEIQRSLDAKLIENSAANRIDAMRNEWVSQHVQLPPEKVFPQNGKLAQTMLLETARVAVSDADLLTGTGLAGQMGTNTDLVTFFDETWIRAVDEAHTNPDSKAIFEDLACARINDPSFLEAARACIEEGKPLPLHHVFLWISSPSRAYFRLKDAGIPIPDRKATGLINNPYFDGIVNQAHALDYMIGSVAPGDRENEIDHRGIGLVRKTISYNIVPLVDNSNKIITQIPFFPIYTDAYPSKAKGAGSVRKAAQAAF